MRTIKNYIYEALKIGGSHKVMPGEGTLAGMEFPDDKKRRFKGNGKPNLWWLFWKCLWVHGQMSKGKCIEQVNIDNELELKPTSYIQIFIDMKQHNMISSDIKGYTANHPDDWKF